MSLLYWTPHPGAVWVGEGGPAGPGLQLPPLPGRSFLPSLQRAVPSGAGEPAGIRGWHGDCGGVVCKGECTVIVSV